MQFNEIVKSCLVNLCKSYGPYKGVVEIDAILYISTDSKKQGAVVKVKEIFEVPSETSGWVENNFGISGKNNESKDEYKKYSSTDGNSQNKSTSADATSRWLDGRVEEKAQTDIFTISSNYCRLCAAVFHSSQELRNHSELKHNLFACHVCHEVFNTAACMEKHLGLHSAEKVSQNTNHRHFSAENNNHSNHLVNDIFKCNLCLYKTSSAESLNTHSINAHKLPLNSVCKLCKEGFVDEGAFEEHFKVHWQFQMLRKARAYPHFQPPNKTPVKDLLPQKVEKTSSNTNKRNRKSAYGKHKFNNVNILKRFSEKLLLRVDLENDSIKEHSNSYDVSPSDSYITEVVGGVNLQYGCHADNTEYNNKCHKNDYSIQANPQINNDALCIEEKEREEKRELEDENENTRFTKDPKQVCHVATEQEGQPMDLSLSSSPIESLQEAPTVKNEDACQYQDCHPDGNPPNSQNPDQCKHYKSISHSTNTYTKHSESTFATLSSPSTTTSHPCNICGEAFSSFDVMDYHCITLHGRSSCFYCSKTFAQKANRDRHHCLHTGKKPYACLMCHQKFPRGDKLKLHQAKVHGVVFPCRLKKNQANKTF